MAQSPLPKLLVSQERAAELLKEQINKGRQITDLLSPSIAGHGFDKVAALRAAKTAGEKWAKFTIDLLKSLVADLSIGKEFGSSDIHTYGGDPTIEFLEWMDDRLHRLDSILQRLSLFPLADAPGRVPVAQTASPLVRTDPAEGSLDLPPMTTPTQATNPQDDRWGGYVPWFFRYSEFSGQGNFELFFQRLSQRIKRLFQYNEAGLANLAHFGAVLETETLQRYRYNPGIGLR